MKKRTSCFCILYYEWLQWLYFIGLMMNFFCSKILKKKKNKIKSYLNAICGIIMSESTGMALG